jgi:hypothetical protein
MILLASENGSRSRWPDVLEGKKGGIPAMESVSNSSHVPICRLHELSPSRKPWGVVLTQKNVVGKLERVDPRQEGKDHAKDPTNLYREN